MTLSVTVKKIFPSKLKFTERTGVGNSIVAMHSPVSTFQSLAVLSAEPESRRVAVRLRQISQTAPAWPS